MRKKKDNKSQQSSGQQTGQPHSPLALLAATCSKVEVETDESPQPQAGGKNSQTNNVQQTVKVINAGSQVINASDLAQYMNMQLATPGQTLGIVNADGTVTQINPQVASSIAGVTAGATIKPVTSIANQSQITQLSQGGVAYSIIPAQQIQNIQIDGQDAIYIPASSFGSTGQQTFQIAGNQIFAQQSNQPTTQNQIVRTSSGQTSTQQTTAVIQGLNNMNLTQLAGGQAVALRQGNMMQTLQLPINSLQQTIAVQVPMQTQNGQTIYQTMQLPISALSSLTGQQVIQQMPQIQMAQIQLPQQTTTTGTIKEDNQTNSQTQVNSTQQTANQNIIATINLPNGQLGQIITAPQTQTVWPANALNLSNLTGKINKFYQIF